MRLLLIAALLVGAAGPAAAQDWKPSRPKAKPSTSAPATKAAGEPGMAEMMKMFDKMFPAQPAPPAARLALARSTAVGVLPSGTYAAMFEDMMSGVVDRVLSISPKDFDKKIANGPRTTLREGLAKEDPHFEERMRITRRVISEELVKISALMEPKLQEGLALAIARRFEEAQLRDINSFLATDSGRAFGAQLMRMWIDPDVMRSMFKSFPEMMTAMPSAMKRVETATAHLPKPKKKAVKKTSPSKKKPMEESLDDEAELVPQT